jgi:diacylglycerol kinase (ATP)
VDLVVAVGGDGTLGEVVGGLGGADVPIAALPLGTANVLALDLGLPRRPAALLEAIAGGRTVAVDVALVNGRASFLVTGVGFDGLVVRALDEARRGPISRWSYVRHGLGALRGYRPPRLAVEIDGERQDGAFGLVIVSNVVHYGGVACLSRDRRLDDGLLEAYLFGKATRPALLGHALRGLLTGLPAGSCRRVRGRRFRIESDEPVPYQVDGDYGGTTPVEIEVTPRPFRLIVP